MKCFILVLAFVACAYAETCADEGGECTAFDECKAPSVVWGGFDCSASGKTCCVANRGKRSIGYQSPGVVGYGGNIGFHGGYSGGYHPSGLGAGYAQASYLGRYPFGLQQRHFGNPFGAFLLHGASSGLLGRSLGTSSQASKTSGRVGDLFRPLTGPRPRPSSAVGLGAGSPGYARAAFAFSNAPRDGRCGVTPLVPERLNDGRISAGFSADADTDQGEFPWHCALLSVNQQGKDIHYICGGTLIHQFVVVTAAHCVHDLKDRKLLVDCGDYNLNNVDDENLFPVIRSHVVNTIIHPEFDPATSRFDAALLVLDTGAARGSQPNINNACLARGSEVLLRGTAEKPADAPIGSPEAAEHPLCYVPGWGYDSYSKTVTGLNTLKKAEMVYVEDEECFEQLRKEPELSEHFRLQPGTFCAMGRSGENACKGDGGGAMVCRVQRGCPFGRRHPNCISDNRWVITGIVSWGVSCGEGRPSVYTDMRSDAMNNWIRAALSGYGFNAEIEV